MNISDYLIATEAAGPNISSILDNSQNFENFVKRAIKKCTKWEIDTFSKGEYSGSRLGGVPYVDSKGTQFEEFNKNPDNEFIAQINLKDIIVRGEFPKSGILQFWSNLNTFNNSKNTVIYYPTIDIKQSYETFKTRYPEYYQLNVIGGKREKKYSAFYNVSEELLYYGSTMRGHSALSLPDRVSDLEFNKKPFYAVTSTKQYLAAEEIYPGIVKRLIGIDLDRESNPWDNSGGYAQSMQDVPWESGNYLLFQIDSSGSAASKAGLWIGDNGVIRWTIESGQLRRKNFSKVFNTSECY